MTVQATATFPRPRAAHRSVPRLHLRRPGDGAVVFALALAVYLSVGAVLVFHGNALAGDGVSRVAIANRILFSRDPHLAAVGFVWSPLPNLALLPLVALKFLWPALVKQAFAGNIVSALFMAGAAYQVLRFLEDREVPRVLRLPLAAAFTLHPMIVLYGANSMSEAQFIFALLLVVRHLDLWLRGGEVRSLVLTGVYLAFAYLTRYEAAAAAGAIVVAVGAASVSRADGALRRRWTVAVCDCLIVILPFAVAFAVWTFVSWIITGSALPQLSSAYGNASQLQAKGLGHLALHDELGLALQGSQWILALEPLLPLVALLLVVRTLVRRDLASLGPASVLGMVLAFMLWAHSTGAVLRTLRYFIVVIPLVLVMIGNVLTPRARSSRWAGDEAEGSARPRRTAAMLGIGARFAAGALCLIVVAAGVPAGWRAVLSTSTNQLEASPLQAMLSGDSATLPQRRASQRFVIDREASQYIDSLHVPRGAVLIDDFLGFVVVMASDRSEQFVITADRDFEKVLASPAENGVAYILVPPDRDLGSLDAINRAYPGIYENGAGIAILVKTFHDRSDMGRDWRLYRVLPTH